MTEAEALYWSLNNNEEENIKYAVANGLMSAEDSGLDDAVLEEKPLTIPEALEARDAVPVLAINDKGQPSIAKTLGNEAPVKAEAPVADKPVAKGDKKKPALVNE